MKPSPWIAWFVLALSAPVLAGQDIDERRDLPADGTVSVSNAVGDIDISTWDRQEVHLTGELGDQSKLDISTSGDTLRIEVRNPRGNSRWGRDYEESDLVLRVPVSASLSVNGVSSDITIRGSRGARVSAETVSGDVQVEAHAERVDLSSVSGDVQFSGASMRTSVETVSGDIELSGLNGELDVSMVSGDLAIGGGRFSMASFESVSGTLEIDLEVEAGGRLTIESMSGDVRLDLPADQTGEFRAQTFSGDIRSKFGSPQKDDSGPGRHLHHVNGNDDTTIRVESFSGDIEIGQK